MAIGFITVKGTRKVANALGRVDRQMLRNLDSGMRQIGLSFVGAVKEEITAVDAVDTGNMRRSVRSESDGPLEVRVGVDSNTAPYAVFVHDGHFTRGRVKFIKPRPFMNRAKLKEQGNIERAIAGLVTSVVGINRKR